MKVTAIETIRLEAFPNLIRVQVHSDQGPIGLGESYFGPGAVEAHIHDFIAPHLLGQDPAGSPRAPRRPPGCPPARSRRSPRLRRIHDPPAAPG